MSTANSQPSGQSTSRSAPFVVLWLLILSFSLPTLVLSPAQCLPPGEISDSHLGCIHTVLSVRCCRLQLSSQWYRRSHSAVSQRAPARCRRTGDVARHMLLWPLWLGACSVTSLCLRLNCASRSVHLAPGLLAVLLCSLAVPPSQMLTGWRLLVSAQPSALRCSVAWCALNVLPESTRAL